MTAITGAHSTNSLGDVVVNSGGTSATLPNGFMFYAPTESIQPPVISGVSSVGPRQNQPSGFANLDDSVTLVPTVFNPDTSGVTLTHDWSGPGAFTPSTDGTTTWHLPATAGQVPTPMTATLVVTEWFAEGKITHRQTSVPFGFVMQVHDSQKEVLDMGQDFLTLFSDSSIPTDQVLHNFSTTCDGGRGRADEASDVDKDRRDFVQNFAAFRITRRSPFSINFGGTCVTSDGRAQPHTDACSSFAVHWEGFDKTLNANFVTNGIDYMSAVVESSQWKLCHSSFVGSQTYPSLGMTKSIAW